MKYESELYHHGILGQKWGKKNGPPYPLNGSQKSSAEKRSNDSPSSEKKSKSSSKKSVKDMSDQELKKEVDRLQLEKRYSDLTKKEESSGKKWISNILNNAASNVIQQLAVYGIATAVNAFFGKQIVNPKKGQKK